MSQQVVIIFACPGTPEPSPAFIRMDAKKEYLDKRRVSMANCNGKCIAGMIVAIIFGALFLWTLVVAYHTHIAGNLWSYSVLPWYLLALVFLAIAKMAKHWAMSCPHCMSEGKAGKK